MYLFGDTETSGLPDYGLPLHDPAQPKILQLALLLCDENGREIIGYKAPIQKPAGFQVDEAGRAFEVNKWSNALLEKYGVPMIEALTVFRELQKKAILKVFHNYRFDGFLLKAAAEAAKFQELTPPIDKFCTMTAMTSIMKLPPTDKMVAAGFSSKPKSAKLSEAYKYCTGKELDGAHDAMADVRGCKEVFFWLLKNGLYAPQPRKLPSEAAAAA